MEITYPSGVNFKCIGLALESKKLTHLVKIYGIRQINKIHILDALSVFCPLSLNLKHQSFLLLDQKERILPIDR